VEEEPTKRTQTESEKYTRFSKALITIPGTAVAIDTVTIEIGALDIGIAPKRR